MFDLLTRVTNYSYYLSMLYVQYVRKSIPGVGYEYNRKQEDPEWCKERQSVCLRPWVGNRGRYSCWGLDVRRVGERK